MVVSKDQNSKCFWNVWRNHSNWRESTHTWGEEENSRQRGFNQQPPWCKARSLTTSSTVCDVGTNRLFTFPRCDFCSFCAWPYHWTQGHPGIPDGRGVASQGQTWRVCWQQNCLVTGELHRWPAGQSGELRRKHWALEKN